MSEVPGRKGGGFFAEAEVQHRKSLEEGNVAKAPRGKRRPIFYYP